MNKLLFKIEKQLENTKKKILQTPKILNGIAFVKFWK